MTDDRTVALREVAAHAANLEKLADEARATRDAMIRVARARHGMTLRAIGAATGLHYSRIQKIVGGSR